MVFSHQSITTILLALLIRSVSSEVHYQRCFPQDNITTTNVSLWLKSSCKPCNGNSEKEIEDRQLLHVAIQLTTPHLQYEILSIASALIMENINVTIFTNFDVIEHILAGIPCTEQEARQPMISIQHVNLNEEMAEICNDIHNDMSSYMDPFHPCSVLMAYAQYAAHIEAFLGDEDSEDEPLLSVPNVLLTDFHGFGALFLAERSGMPSILLADEISFYESIGRGEKLESSFWQYLKSIPSEMYRSLWATSTCRSLNKFRVMTKMEPRSTMAEFWDSVTGIMVLANRDNSTTLPQQRGQYPPMMHLKKPVLSPCMACDNIDQIPKQQKDEPVPSRVEVVFLPPVDLGAHQAREVLRGLSLARKSLLSYNSDECTAGPTRKQSCPPGSLDLHVKWLDNGDYFSHEFLAPDPIPSFVEVQDASFFLDSVLRSFHGSKRKGRLILIARCCNDARPALLLRVPTLCLPRGESSVQPILQDDNDSFRVLDSLESGEIATKLIHYIWTLQQLPEETALPHYDSSEGESLQHIVAAIRSAGSLYNVAGEDSYLHYPEELQDLFAHEMEKQRLLVPRSQAERPLAHKILYWLACHILGLWLCAVLFRWLFPGAIKYLRIISRSVRNRLQAPVQVLEALMFRLPEIDSVWEGIMVLWNGRSQERPGVGETSISRRNNRGRGPLGGRGSNTSHKKRIGKHR